MDRFVSRPLRKRRLQTPSWLGEVALVASHLQKQEILNKISERVRFARRRFGRYDVLDFLAVQIALCDQRRADRWRAFYESVHPFAVPFMALFGRASLPAASTLSRFLAALPAEPIEALRTLFLQDLLACRLSTEEQDARLWDRQGNRWLVFDVDGTREAARQRALPQTPDRPAPQRRLRPLCAPGYTGRKRGEIVRTRTTILQMHTHQWVASFGQYDTGAVVSDVAGISYVTRGKDYKLLDRADIQARLHLPGLSVPLQPRSVPGRKRPTRAHHCGDPFRPSQKEKETAGRNHPSWGRL
jgi:hypothetical protein